MTYAYDYNAPRPRALSWDGYPQAPQVVQQPVAPVSPRYYATNQPAYRPGVQYGAPAAGGWGVARYPGGYTAAPAYNTGYAAPQYAPQGYAAPQYAPQYGYAPPAQPVQPLASNSQVCCPLPGPTEEPAPSQSAHAFQSNLPAGECEGLVRRDVEYQTEWVAVPVQKPVVYETYQRVVEIPTQHLVNVQNVPGMVPPRQCEPNAPAAIMAPTTYGPTYQTASPTAGPYMSTSPVPWAGQPAVTPVGGRLGRTFSY